MKIIQKSSPSQPAAGAPDHSVSAPDVGRVEVLEHIVKSTLQKLQALEERVQALEESRPTVSVTKEPSPSLAEVSAAPSQALPPALPLNTDSLKNGLLIKMWKYLNDERASKAA